MVSVTATLREVCFSSDKALGSKLLPPDQQTSKVAYPAFSGIKIRYAHEIIARPGGDSSLMVLARVNLLIFLTKDDGSSLRIGPPDRDLAHTITHEGIRFTQALGTGDYVYGGTPQTPMIMPKKPDRGGGSTCAPEVGSVKIPLPPASCFGPGRQNLMEECTRILFEVLPEIRNPLTETAYPAQPRRSRLNVEAKFET
ncbi:hypothetical protein BDM02DRAFT_3133386 [Thelephora ganbajun]|uniref:Uncharacterized protein n=1 Tax=Thelephora ganbajun TaxID=370292 RepID=A0ACB6YXP0_THEGA|nr:hypothetical protein BDM02DRAFT_3133386 [Thelephora ganbajun]